MHLARAKNSLAGSDPLNKKFLLAKPQEDQVIYNVCTYLTTFYYHSISGGRIRTGELCKQERLVLVTMGLCCQTSHYFLVA